MGIRFPWDTVRRIESLEAIPNRTPQQEERLQRLREVYTQGQKSGPSLSYPTKSTRVRPSDTLFKSRVEWARIMLRDINHPKGTIQNLDNASTLYNPNPTQGFFTQRKTNPNHRSFVSLDIETDDYGHPISISALKFQYDKNQKQFVSTDNYQRFYKTHGWDIRSTQAVHGFTPGILNNLRKQQGATYGKTYRGSEIDDLKAYLGNSVIVGHNIQQFDLNKLFPEETIKNSTIDTLAAARNAWEGKKNDLDHVFYRLFGKTMEQVGLSHHDANADTVASMMILEKMAQDPGEVGQAIKYVMGAKGQRQLVEYDKILGSMVVKGTYKSGLGSGGKKKLSEVYMTAEELGLKKKGAYVSGFHEDIPMSPDQMSDDQLLKSALVDATQYLKSHRGGGNIGGVSEDLFEAINQFNNYKRLSLVKSIASAKSEESITALARAAGYSSEGKTFTTFREMADNLRSARERELKDEQYVRIDKLRKQGKISESDYNDLHKIKYLKGSYDDLVEATDEVVAANKRLIATYQGIAGIRPYDINDLVGTAHSQWSGIKGAARGVIPNFILNPISRLGDAAFNDVNKKLAPWNAVQRIYNNTLGSVLKSAYGTSNIGGALASGGGYGAGMGFGTGIGVVRAGEQVIGNVAQAKIEMTGQGIQNTLNTLGAMISWISTPFQLLHKALKLAIGSLGGFTYKLNSFMGSGIGLMSQMGNPLTELTGMGYGAYSGSTMMDIASLFSKGSMNSIYEDFANQQQAMYMGNFNLDRMIAASMLGIYDKAYTPGTDAMGTYNSMANKLLNDLKSQSPSQQARTMYFASQIDKNLPSLLRTANLLGVNDVNVLTNPGNRGMYWNPIASEGEQRAMRWTQYEYGAAKEQMGVSKMRISNMLWNAGGKTIYNVFNEIVDRIAGGDITGAVKRASEVWGEFATKFKGVWESLKGSFGADDNNIAKTFKAIGLQLVNVVIDVGMKIIEIWDTIMLTALKKAQGIVAYLSTIHVDVYKDKNGIGFNITSIKDAKYSDSDKLYEEGVYGGIAAHSGIAQPKEGMDKVVALANMFGVYGKEGSFAMQGYNPTIGDVKDAIRRYRDEYGLKAITLPEGFPMQQVGTDEESLDALFTNIAMSTWGRGGKMEAAAAAYLTPDLEYMSYDRQKAYDATGIYGVGEKLITGTEDAARTALMGIRNSNIRAIAELRITDDSGKKSSLIADTKEGIMSKDLALLSQMMPDGLKLVYNALK